MSDHYYELVFDVYICTECHQPEPLPPPVDIQTSCDLVVWRNAPNISYDDIIGYEIQFINSVTNEKVTKLLDSSATFYNLNNLNETFNIDLTYVQVGSKNYQLFHVSTDLHTGSSGFKCGDWTL